MRAFSTIVSYPNGASGRLKQKMAVLLGIPLGLQYVPLLRSGKIGGTSGML